MLDIRMSDTVNTLALRERIRPEVFLRFGVAAVLGNGGFYESSPVGNHVELGRRFLAESCFQYFRSRVRTVLCRLVVVRTVA